MLIGRVVQRRTPLIKEGRNVDPIVVVAVLLMCSFGLLVIR
jgi:hypothetical protein